MGRKEINDYVIYKIVCLSNPDLVYVGSTANFYVRRKCHKNVCNNPNDRGYNDKKYVTIRENGGWENWNMIIIDELKQVTLIKSRQIEEDYRVKLNANLNSKKCFTTPEERKEYKKEYVENNKALIKEYVEKNKEKIAQHHREWREKNKEQLVEKKQKYYRQNKEHLSECSKKRYLKKTNQEQLKIIVGETITCECECGCVVKKKGLSAHKLTQKHINLINK